MSIGYYTQQASDWQVSSVASGGAFDAVGGGGWVFEFKSPTVCEQPVAFFYVGGGAGFGSGASTSDSSLETKPKKTEFTSIECDRAFSLADLDGAGGRLSVLEGFIFGYGGGIVCISAFDLSGSLFNSQEIGGMSLATSLTKKVSGTIATTVGRWQSPYSSMVPSRAGKESPQHQNEECSIYGTPPSLNDLKPNLSNWNQGPTIGPARSFR